jgi:hypothetical protein
MQWKWPNLCNRALAGLSHSRLIYREANSVHSCSHCTRAHTKPHTEIMYNLFFYIKTVLLGGTIHYYILWQT